MLDEKKRSKKDLVSELAALRLKIADLERYKVMYEQTLEDLTGKKREYRTIFDFVPARIMYFNPEGKVLRANKAIAKIIGLAPVDIIGKYLHDFFQPEEAARRFKEHREIMESGNARFGAIEQIAGYKGKSRWLRVDKIPYRDKKGNIIGIIVFAVDITDQKKTEEDLAEAEERFRHFMEHVPIYVFFKDDGIRPIQLSRNYEKMLGRPVEDLIGKTMNDLFPSDLAKSMIEDDKRVLSEGKPIEIEEEFNGRSYTTTKFPLVREGKPPLLAGFTMDITDRKKSEAKLQENLQELRKLLNNTIQVIFSMIEAKAPFISGHQKRVSDLARTIAGAMDLSHEQIEGVRVAGSLHDLGMIAVPGELLGTPRRLTDYEFNLLKTHPLIGYNILKDIEFPWPVADIILQHHERMDGSGYPNGIRNDAILVEARILAVADVVEAIASHRPYRPASSIDTALKTIEDSSGILYDPSVVDKCVSLFREKGYRFRED